MQERTDARGHRLMRRPRWFTPHTERIAERFGFVLYILAAVVVLGGQYVADVAGSKTAASPSASASPTPRAATVTAAATVSPSPVTTRSASPSPTRDPLGVAPYVNGGRRFAALTAPVGYTLNSPIAGTVSVVVYQLLDGDIRVGSNVPSEPFYPYVTISSPDLKLVLRPGALKRDVELVVKDGDTIRAGAPLFTFVGSGASSWHAFYDSTLSAQVLASVTASSSGAQLDPVALFSH